MIRIKTPSGEYVLPFSRETVAELKRFATFDGASKTWHAEYLPCSFARRFLPAVECFEGRWWRGVAFVEREPPREKVCFTVQRWRQVTCEEYCEERCEYNERCAERCEERCEEEGWTPRVREEEEICLAKRTERGDWQVPRGLVPLLGVKMPRFAQLPPLDLHPDLRPYQVDVLTALWERLQQAGAGTVQMATGAGKSYTAGFLAAALARAGYHVFLTALQLDLVNQLAAFAEKWGASRELLHPVTIQTLYRRLTKRHLAEDARDDEEESAVLKAYADETHISDSDFGIFAEGEKVAVIVDEAHHVPARTVKEVVSAAGRGWALRVGLTATPWRNDGRDLEIYAHVGAVVEPRITSSFLIEHGYAVPVEIRVVDAPNCAPDADSWAEEVSALVDCEQRNKFIAKLAESALKPVLVTTTRVRHAVALAELVKGASVEVATGAVKGDERMRIYETVKRGEVEVLVATTIADEGLDLPPLRTLIVALAGKSRTRTLQRAGRLTRPWPGKDRGILYELRDPNTVFSARHLQQRLELYKTEPAWTVNYA